MRLVRLGDYLADGIWALVAISVALLIVALPFALAFAATMALLD